MTTQSKRSGYKNKSKPALRLSCRTTTSSSTRRRLNIQQRRGSLGNGSLEDDDAHSNRHCAIDTEACLRDVRRECTRTCSRSRWVGPRLDADEPVFVDPVSWLLLRYTLDGQAFYRTVSGPCVITQRPQGLT